MGEVSLTKSQYGHLHSDTQTKRIRTTRYARRLYKLGRLCITLLWLCCIYSFAREESIKRLLPRAYREFRRQYMVDWRVQLEQLQVGPRYGVRTSEMYVFVIALNRTSHRRERTVESLVQNNVTHSIFQAVDGLDRLDEGHIKRYAGSKKEKRLRLTQFWTRERLTRLLEIHASGSLNDKKLRAALHERLRFGCYMSHVLLWRHIITHRLPFAVILEDDVVLVDNFSASLRRLLAELPQNWGLLYLNGSFKKFGARYDEGLVQSRGGVGAFGYVISSSAASHFLSKAPLNSEKAVDHMMDEEVLSGKVFAFHAVPPLVELTPNVLSTLAYL